MILTSGGVSLLLDYLAAGNPGDAPNPPFYFAVGSGTLPVTQYMVRLPGETFRQPIVATDTDGDQVIYHGYLDVTDNRQQTIGCYGVFGGDATLALDSGTLVAIANEQVPFVKDSTTTFSLDMVLTVSGAVGTINATATNAILTSGGLSLVRDYLAAGDPDDAPAPPTYMAFGPTAAIGRFMTTVPGETFRQSITDAARSGQTVVFSSFLGTTDNNAAMGTYGLFAGSATSATDSGTLVVLASGAPFTKTSANALQVDLAVMVSGTVG